MRRIREAALTVGLIATAVMCGTARAQAPVEIRNGFYTGSTFRDSQTTSKRAYAAGLMDGMLLAPLFGAPKASMYRLENCIANMTDEQLAAILSKELEEHSESWQGGAHVAMYRGMISRCPREAK